MIRRDLPRPTDGELAILRVLWQRGPSTVRELHDDIKERQQIGYTTVLKLLQIMTEKGLVVRDEKDRAHIYSTSVTEEKTQRQLVGDLMHRAFDGSAAKLVIQALSSKRTSDEEIAEIRRLLETLEKRT